MVRTSTARGAKITAFAVGVLLLVAACGPSPQTQSAGPGTRTAGPTTSATVTSPTPTSPTPTSSTTTRLPTSPPSVATSTTASAAPTSPSSPTASNTSPPAVLLPRSATGGVVNRLPTQRKVVALTFDAGANGDGVNKILATLAKEQVAATFFLTGHFVDSFPALTRRMAAAGRVGNHTADHPHLPTLTDTAVRGQVTDAEAAILRVTGEDPRPLFRFPFGDSTSGNRQLVKALGYVAVGWTVDTLGWQGTSGGRSVDSIVQRVLNAAVPGEIVLMHVGSHPRDHSTLDADSLPRVISGLHAAGYGFVTLDALER